MLLAKLDIKNTLVLIFQEGMNKKNKKKHKKKQKKNEVKKKQVQKKLFFYIPNNHVGGHLSSSCKTDGHPLGKVRWPIGHTL